MRVVQSFCVIFLCVSFLSCSVFAQDATGGKLLEKGIYQFRQENYDEALVTFEEVVKEEPTSSLATYYLGLTYKRMEDYLNAKKYLEESLSLKPKIKNALIELIDLFYRLGEYDEAKKWIDVAEKADIRPAQSQFLKGLTLQKTGEYEQSVEAFNEAKNLDERLEQSANYQIGISYIKMNRYHDAKEALENVYVIDPYSQLGDYANRYVDALEGKIARDRPFHFLARAAFEYDSNVVLSPTDTSNVVGISNRDDTRQVFDVKGDYTWRTQDGSKSFKTGYGFHLSKQNDIGIYDNVGNYFYSTLNLSFDKILVTFPFNFNHTIVDDKNYLWSVSGGNINSIMLPKSQMLQLGVLYSRKDYMDYIFIPEENRDANQFFGLIGWYWFYAENKGFVNLRYTIDKDWTRGSNWEYLGHRASAGILYPFWDKFRLTINGDVYFQDFNKTHSIFNVKRKDQTYTAGALLTYEFLKNFELQFRYTYINEQSNIDIYDYDRHIVSTGIQFKY